MNINFNYFPSEAFSFFKENFLSSLIVQNKKIFLVVAIVFGILATCYTVRCYGCFKGELIEDQTGRLDSRDRIETHSAHKVAILIHGCHVQAKEWDNIVFGSADHLGRVPVGIEEAIHKKAILIFWGSGASQTHEGQKESEYTFQQAIGPKLEELAWYVKKESQELSKYLKQVSYIDHEARNTTEELELATKECDARGISELILISSPTHIARCLQEACKLKSKQPHIGVKFYARASDTCFADSTPEDIVIIEPPHREDMSKVPFHRTAKRIFQFLRNPEIADAFHNRWIKLIEEYQKQMEEMEKKRA